MALKRTNCWSAVKWSNQALELSIKLFVQPVTRHFNLSHNCVRAKIPQRRPSQAAKGGDFGGHLVEKAFNAGDPLQPAQAPGQFMQKFPFGARVALGLNVLREALHAPFGVDEAAALLRVGAAGQKVMRQLGGLIRQNIADDQRLEFRQHLGGDAVLLDDFADGFAFAQFLVAHGALDDVLAEDRERRDVEDNAAAPPAGFLAGRPPCAYCAPVVRDQQPSPGAQGVEQRARVLALFNWRKDKPTKLKWFQQLPAAPVQSKGG